MDSQGVARRRWAVALLALLIVVGPAACSSGGGEAEQKADSREKDDEADDDRGDDEDGGAPGEDAGGSDEADDDDSDSSSDDEADDSDAAGAARTAYVGYQTMFERLVIEPDSDDPEIADRTSGAELNHVVDTLTGFESQNLAVEFGSLHEHHVYDVDASGDTATVLDCFVSDARVVNATTRRTLRGDPDGGTASIVTATVVHSSDGTWRVDATSAEQLGAHETCGGNGVIRPGT